MPLENPGGTPPETAGIHYNRLINEKSPYLLQHAANPVDWYPWGEEAFARALNEDKPVFLSIGYATCHWCHVMAHESFEDEGVAAFLNTDFICIKVDREERPDIDSIYMSVCQMMTGQGGWPLTVIVTPERKPIFAGTYIPREGRFGGYGLLDLLPRITNLWKARRTDLIASAEEIVVALRKTQVSETVAEPDRSLIQDGYDELAVRFDEVNGGFGSAPKFPTPYNLLFLLHFWKRTGKPHARAMAEKTLDAIRRGGICDQVGGGFHRYSTDAWWRVPHFEKMLCDQALLLMAYTEIFQVTRNPQYRKTAEEIIAYVLRDLTSPEGAFFSAEDADSTGGEGAFYLWTKDEMEKVLGKDDAAFAARFFSMKDTGNYPDMAENKGQNILYLSPSSSFPASPSGTAGADAESRLASIKTRLFNARESRSRPSRDDKILADWNGLFIAALALAARAFGNDTYLAAARKAMQFIQDHMHDEAGRLLHRYRDGEAAIPAFGDDYACVIKALIELYESSFDPSYLSSALEHNAGFLSRFWDAKQGGFFTTADSAEILLVRKKEIYDGAVPSCNSLAFENLVRLAHLTGDLAYTRRASDLSRCFSGTVQQSPSAFSGFLCALDLAIGPAHDVVIAGDLNDSETRSMIRALGDHYLPDLVVLYLPADDSRSQLVSLAPFTANLGSDRGIATAYVCSAHTCALPVTSVGSLLELLGVQQD